MQHSPSRFGSFSYTIDSSRKRINQRDFNTPFEISAGLVCWRAGTLAHKPCFRLLRARNDSRRSHSGVLWRVPSFRACNICSRTKIETSLFNKIRFHATLFVPSRGEEIFEYLAEKFDSRLVERSSFFLSLRRESLLMTLPRNLHTL